MPFFNQLEPEGLVRQFLAHPPAGFHASVDVDGLPLFRTAYDVATTLEPDARRSLARWPGYRHWQRWLRLSACFVGTPVTEYAWLPRRDPPASLALRLRRQLGSDSRLLIVKDLPQASPLLDADANRFAAAFADACQREGFVLLQGQALAWVPIDFDTTDLYLARLSASRRRDIRRKLRARANLDVQLLRSGDTAFAADATINEYYDLYLAVHAQSEIHFDCLSRDFFANLLRDGGNGGIVFAYRAEGRLIGWNLCFVHANMLVDKYIGLRYPDARQHNLYVVSWMENLDYARRQGLSHYIAGWTDPQIKRQLGAQLTFTRHAVRPRNWLLRALLRRLVRYFESDHHLLATSD